MSHDIQYRILPIRRVEIPVQGRSQPREESTSRVIRPDGRQIEYAGFSKKASSFFASIWKEITDLFLPVYALSSKQLQCASLLRKAGIGENSTRVGLVREMTKVFNREYRRVCGGSGTACIETHRSAGKAAATEAINKLIKMEKAKNRWIPVAVLDSLNRELQKLKDEPQPVARQAQGNRLELAGSWTECAGNHGHDPGA